MVDKTQGKTPHYKTHTTLDTQKEEEIDPTVEFVVDSWELWNNHWSDKFSDFDRYYDQWIGIPPKRDEDWQSQFNKKLTWQAVAVLVSRFHSALWPVPAPIEQESTEVEDELQGILGKSIVSHWFKIGKFSMEFLKGMRSSGIYGTGLFEDDWYQRKEIVNSKVDKDVDDFRPLVDDNGAKVLDDEGNIRSEAVGTRKVRIDQSKLEVVEDRYRVRKVSIYSWRVHPNKVSDDDDFPAIKQEFITFSDLQKRQAELEKYGLGSFDDMDKIKTDTFKIDETDKKRQQKGGEYHDKKNPRLEVLHYWGLWTEDDSKNAEKVPSWIMIVNRKFKIKVSENPYWHKKPPLFHIVWTEDEKESYYGIGLAQIGESAENRANSVVNTRTDIKKKNIRSGGWYNALDKKIKKTHLVDNTPGRMKPCSDISKAVKYDDPPSLSQDDYKEEETAVNDHREITGATSSLLPTENKKNQPDTLGGMQLVIGQSAQRLKPDLLMMESMGIRKMANRAFLLTRQFLTKSEAIELVASADERKRLSLDKIYNLGPKEILGKMEFYSTGLSESIEKGQNIDKLMKYAEVTGKIPGMQEITNYQGIAKRIALWLGFEDVEEFVQMNPQDPLAQALLPQQQQQPQSPQQGGGLPQENINRIAQSIQQPG